MPLSNHIIIVQLLFPVVSCGPLTDPVNGAVTVTGTMSGSTATYSCDPGYMIVGDSTRTCGTDGMWTLATFSCEREQH